MLIEKLSAEELEMMDVYRKYNAWSYESYNHNNNYAPMTSILREWDRRKSEYLYKLFGDELIISKKIAYVKSYEELQDELSAMMQSYSSYGRAGRNGYEFSSTWGDYLYRNRNLFTADQLDGLHRLFSDDCLISNIYDGHTFEVETPSGKPFKVNRGCKVGKTLGKLATIFDLPGYEDFRICHSQILNQKDLGGVLSLSIHPMDYMTMSDNAYDWESCMSWTREGGYRQGTVEMMNSRSVIVAYLSGDVNFEIDRDHQWNSKKWRQLFVVDHNVIAGVKDYPYHNENLGKEVINWLKELVEEKIGWTYQDVKAVSFDGSKIHLDYLPAEKNDFFLEFETGSMYNDFGCLDSHWMCFADDICVDEIRGQHTEEDDRWNRVWLPVAYSGSSECIICGELDPCFEDESCLACDECQDRSRCDCCGEVHSETYEVDGMHLCEYCWDNRVHECSACGEEHYDEHMTPIYVIPRLSAEKQAEMREHYLQEKSYYSCSFCENEEDVRNAEFNFCRDNTDIWICEDPDCFEKWIKEFMKPGERPHRREMRWSSDVFVYYDQLTEDGQEEYAWGCDGDNQRYADSFRMSRAEPTRFINLL